jgi:hypothetical protein
MDLSPVQGDLLLNCTSKQFHTAKSTTVGDGKNLGLLYHSKIHSFITGSTALCGPRPPLFGFIINF